MNQVRSSLHRLTLKQGLQNVFLSQLLKSIIGYDFYLLYFILFYFTRL